jgi:PEP-CTERM motif
LKLRMASLTILCLALAAVPALAQNWSYDNGPINGTIDSWVINFGTIVSDSYIAQGSNVTGFSFGAWEFPGDTLSSVDWSITLSENSGHVFGSGTASTGGGAGGMLVDTFVSANNFGFNVDNIAVTGLNVPELKGVTYWLNLQNATVPNGDPVYWDENSGTGCGGAGCPSSASESVVGTIPSEAFTIGGGSGTGTTPEPSSIMLFGSGILGLAGVLRRKLF